MTVDLAQATIIDVRTPGEYAQGHYPGALNIPLGEVPRRLRDIDRMQKPVIFYCRSGNRSGMAVTLLRQTGVREVYNGGGLQDMHRIGALHRDGTTG